MNCIVYKVENVSELRRYRGVKFMAEEKKGKAEEVAEETGKLVGKSVKKGWGGCKKFW
jgi:hypothetical protein